MKNHYKFWIAFSLILVFAAGVLGGILFEQNILDKKTKKITRKRAPVRFPSLEMMAEELNLTEDQQEQIREIFNNNEERFKIMRSQIHERFSSIRSQLKSEIKNVLTEEQNIKFEAMIEKYLSQRRKEQEERKKHSKKIKKNKGEEK